MDASTFVASLDATAGSVMAKHERISPRSNGASHRRCCAGVPYLKENLHVARVRRRTVERLRRPHARAHAPREVRVLEVREPRTGQERALGSLGDVELEKLARIRGKPQVP